MTIANTDKILVNRAGSSYHVEAQNFNDKAQASDILLVNRAGQSYKCSRAALDAKLLDTDILMINRGGISYKVTGAEFKTLLTVAPDIASVTVTELTPGGFRWTDQSFKLETIMAEEGNPISSKTIHAYIEGKFVQTLIADTITGWDSGSKTLTFATDKDLFYFEADDHIVQNDATLVGSWTKFNADSSNTATSSFSAIGASRTTTFIAITDPTVAAPYKTFVQYGPISNQGPWTEVEVPGIQTSLLEIIDDVLYLVGRGTIAISVDNAKSFDVQTIEGVPSNDRPTGFVKWNNQYYLNAAAKVYSSDTPQGPYTEDTRFTTAMSVDGINVTPWGLFFGKATSSTQAFVTQLTNDNNIVTHDFGDARLKVVKGGAYQNGTLAYQCNLRQGTSDYLTYITTTDGENFKIKSFNNYRTSIQSCNITKQDKVSSVAFMNNNSAFTYVVEYDPVTETIANVSSVINTYLGASSSRDSSTLAMHFQGEFKNIWGEGTIVPSSVVDSVDVANKQMTLSYTSGDWSVGTGSFAIGPTKALEAKKNVKFSDAGDVIDLLPENQMWSTTTTDTNPTLTLTFPSTFPSGRAPDDEIAPGAQLYMCVEASNDAGSDGPLCDFAQPDTVFRANYSMDFDNYRDLFLSFETYEYRTAVAKGEPTPNRDALIAKLEAEGYALPEITTLIGEEEDNSSGGY